MAQKGCTLKDWTKPELEKELSHIKTAVTIPVAIHIDGQQRILDLTQMERILKEAKLISLGECGCRSKLHNCSAPLDVCFSLDREAEQSVSKGLGKQVTLEQALDALRRSHEAGLVHITYTFQEKEKPEVICSCCSCCCSSLSALVRFGIPNAVVASKYIASQNDETCINCGKCVDRCQFKARQLKNGKLQFDENRCFGCGVCTTTCPTNSITLVPRK
jgi:ferredoxin